MTLQIKCGPVTDTQSCNDKCIQNTISNGSIHIAGRKSIPMVQFDIADSISKRFGFPGNSQPWTIWILISFKCAISLYLHSISHSTSSVEKSH